MTKTLYAEFTVKPGCEAEVAEMVRQLTEMVHREPGNLQFTACTVKDRPREYFIFEIYRDIQAFQAHISAGHSLQFNEKLSDLIEGETSALTWLEQTS